ncbi:MAG: DUF4136 domain-containing protein [Bacteroidetes bacterium]|nr:DUF4136 domain-containing protein [Bacteroidota bacterium]MBU2584875.1 DUF4136 domain-containing protein [Bacteroidota bacterium]
MKKIILLSAIFLIAILFISCAVSKATLNSYVDPNITNEKILKLAIFPIRNAKFAPSEAQQINRKISMAINQQNSQIEIMSSNEAINKLNENDLASTWAVFLDNYSSSGVPDKNVLYDVGQSLGIDAIIQGEIVNVFQQDGAYGINKGTTRVTVRFSMLSTNSGKLLWEASSDGIKGTPTTLESAPPIIEAVDLAVDKILSNLPLK